MGVRIIWDDGSAGRRGSRVSLRTRIGRAYAELRGLPVESGIRTAHHSEVVWQRSQRGGGTLYGNLKGGGIVNRTTGMGTNLDKSEGAFFTPTFVYSRTPWEVLYVESWAARKYIDIPVDDALSRWRDWEGDEGDAAVETMEDAEKRHQVRAAVGKAWKAGRKFGTSLLCMMTREAPLDTELMPERIREGDLASLRVFDRFAAYVNRRDDDPMSPTFGQPLEYYVFPRKGSGFYIHASRVIRFDGIAPSADDGYDTYDYDWGVSDLVPAILAIQQDQALATAAAHLAQVASIPVLGVEGLRETMAGDLSGEASAADIGEQVNEMMSIFRLLMLDKGSEEFNRVAVSFGGLDKVQERFERRVAAAGDIPITRFWGASPGGLNATGDSDRENYFEMLMGKRDDALSHEKMSRFDEVLARDAGLPEVPSWAWHPFSEASEGDVATASKTKAEAIKLAVEASLIDEDEGREALDGDPTFGPLPGEAPEPDPEPMPMLGGTGAPPMGAPKPNGAATGRP